MYVPEQNIQFPRIIRRNICILISLHHLFNIFDHFIRKYYQIKRKENIFSNIDTIARLREEIAIIRDIYRRWKKKFATIQLHSSFSQSIVYNLTCRYMIDSIGNQTWRHSFSNISSDNISVHHIKLTNSRILKVNIAQKLLPQQFREKIK